jgi:hypothetical protein
MNYGPTVLVSAQHAGIQNVMAAAWACVLDYGKSTKVTVVLDKSTFTRGRGQAIWGPLVFSAITGGTQS